MESKDERFRTIYEKNYPLLYCVARKMGVPSKDIEDMIQEAFLSFYRHYPATLPDLEIRAILAKIVRNCSIDYKRRTSVRPLSYWDPMESFLSWKCHKGVMEDVLGRIIHREEYEEVMAAIGNMKKDWADVLVLLIIQERPVKEVCEMLNIKEDACRMRLMRARKYLRERFRTQKKSEVQRASAAPHSSEIPGNI